MIPGEAHRIAVLTGIQHYLTTISNAFFVALDVLLFSVIAAQMDNEVYSAEQNKSYRDPNSDRRPPF